MVTKPARRGTRLVDRIAETPSRPDLSCVVGRLRVLRAGVRRAGLVATALLPQRVKQIVYRWCFGYRIGRGVRIGLSYLDCAALTLADGAQISHGVLFVQCGTVRVGRRVLIGPLNLFRGGKRIQLDDYSQLNRLNIVNAILEHDCTNEPDSSFHLGFGAVVTAEHRIDFTDRVSIGRFSVLGGRNSSIWTHNRRVAEPVGIGDYCYLGSEIRIAPGARVPDCCVVGLGSVVTRPIEESYSLIAGVPAKRRRGLTADDHDLIFGKTRPDLPDAASGSAAPGHVKSVGESTRS
jgi:acetyltransferase-like isoleucine patch superfamily enzyme